MGQAYNKTIITYGDLSNIIHLFDEAVSNMVIYSVETRNIRRGEAELNILGETE